MRIIHMLAERQLQTGQQRSKWRRTLSFGKKLVAETIITGLLLVNFTGCATAGNNGRNARAPKDEIKKEEINKNKTRPRDLIKAEEIKNAKPTVTRTIKCDGYSFLYKVEVKGDQIYEYIDGKLWKVAKAFDLLNNPEKAFGNSFNMVGIVDGNPSTMFVGIDSNGHYGFILRSRPCGEIEYVAITTELPAERLEELGIKMEIKYDEERHVWITNYYDKKGKLLAYDVYSEDGKELENKTFGLCEIDESLCRNTENNN